MRKAEPSRCHSSAARSVFQSWYEGKALPCQERLNSWSTDSTPMYDQQAGNVHVHFGLLKLESVRSNLNKLRQVESYWRVEEYRRLKVLLAICKCSC